MLDWPVQLSVTIETPRWSVIKRRDDGSIDFITPIPCPFNYGSVAGTLSGDGDRQDALVLGGRLSRGRTIERRVWACIDFVDAGELDPKWICGVYPPTSRDLAELRTFFQVYERAKRLLNSARRRSRETLFRGLLLHPGRAPTPGPDNWG